MFLNDCSPQPIRVLLLEGQSINHNNWKEVGDLLLKHLKDYYLIEMDRITSPKVNESMDGFKPDFSQYDVIVSSYDGAPWPVETDKAFVDYIKNGGGFAIIHAANNSFPEWPEYNEIIGLGGWGARDSKAGPYVYYNDEGELIRDESPGVGGAHGDAHAYVVETRTDHPILKGLPKRWKHAKDELYEKLRGPAKNMTVLATAYADPATKGSGRHEPALMIVEYGEGRIFHSIMGHDTHAASCVGFLTTFIRGVEWAAGRKVKYAVPEDFPTETEVRTR